MPDIRLEAFRRKEALIQENDGFAVIWREAQRKRGELIGLWFSQILIVFGNWGGLIRSLSIRPPPPFRPTRQASEVLGRLLLTHPFISRRCPARPLSSPSCAGAASRNIR